MNDGLLRYCLEKCCVLDVEFAELSTRNHLVIIFLFFFLSERIADT